MTNQLPWVRKIASEFLDLHTIPFFGNSPPFDWDSFSSSLSSQLSLPQLSVRGRNQQWREESELREGFGSQIHILPINASPIGTVYWMMSLEDIRKLTSWLIKPSHRKETPLSEILQEGFYRYLILEALQKIQHLPPFLDVTLQLSEEDISASPAFCIDVEIDFEEKRCWGRIAIPKEFRRIWIQHFSHQTPQYFPKEIARQTELPIGLKIGTALLSQKEWKQLREGDFLLLDSGSYDPRKGTGLSLLMLQSIPIFNTKIKHHQIELIDYAFYYEDNMEQKGNPSPEKTAHYSPAEGEVVALKELPVYVCVELARIKMTLDHLMQLIPGNILEIPIHPEQGVSLTVDGKLVARGELVYLGEQLGVRILEI